MGLIHQKQVAAFAAFAEIPGKPYIRVEGVIIVADDSVHEIRNIQRKFKGADPVFFGVSAHHFPVYGLFLCDDIQDGLIYPVKVPPRPRTVLGIAVCLFHDADLLFCRQCDGMEKKPLLAENVPRFLRSRSGGSPGRQIENPLPQSFPDGLHAGIHRGHGFSDSGRCLDKQFPAPLLCGIDRHCQVSLARPVGKWKLQIPDALIPPFLVLGDPGKPADEFSDHALKPVLQLLRCFFQQKVPDLLFIIQIAVCHPDLYPGKLTAPGIDAGVAHGLRQVNLHRFFHLQHIPVYALDLIDHRHLTVDNAVGTALHRDFKTAGFHRSLQEYLRMVAFPRRLLQLPVQAASGSHRITPCFRRNAVVDISGPEDEFHQIPHGDAGLPVFCADHVVSFCARGLFPGGRCSAGFP